MFASSAKSTGPVTVYAAGNVHVHLRDSTIHIPSQQHDNRNAVELNRLFSPAAVLYELAHDNINRFVGICLDYRAQEGDDNDGDGEPKVVVVFKFQPKGSLRDMLNNTDWSMDADLKNCLVADCVRGMQALHAAKCVHGFLHTSNVVMNAKFTCEITDYGLTNFARVREDIEPVLQSAVSANNSGLEKLIFRAPEQIKNGLLDVDAYKCDLYSTGILLTEIVTRDLPKFNDAANRNVPYESVLQRYLSPSSTTVEPTIAANDADAVLRLLIRECTRFHAAQRPPSMNNVYRRLLAIPGFAATASVVDSLVLRLQRYANGLESVVEERTRALMEESRRSEQLLLEILPPSVASELKRGNHVDPQLFEQVSVYFSDLVEFEQFSRRSTPMQLVKLLNWLYTTFDGVLEQFDVYKVETVGDAYMVASGVPKLNGQRHAEEICRFSMAMMKTVNTFKNTDLFSMVERNHHNFDDDTKPLLCLRVGLHSGPCVAGVIGVKLPRYCL